MEYEYDLLGNITRSKESLSKEGQELKGKEQNFTYNEKQQLTNDGQYNYEYDSKGRQIKKESIDKNQLWKYSWNAADQLIKVEHYKGGAATPEFSESYTYDESGQRVKSDSTEAATIHIYSGLKLIYERKVEKRTGGKTTTKQLAYALGKHQVTVEKVDNEPEKTYYHHNDLIGTTRFIRDSNWNMVAENIVSPYGKPLVSKEVKEGTKQGHMKWAGHDSINENTGLTYMQARWMDNSTGRFISRDPIKDGYNWYAYCAGNPISYVDPTGLESYTVQNGDWLTTITNAYNKVYGTDYSYQFIADYNGIANANLIYPGQVINFPDIIDISEGSSSYNNSSNISNWGHISAPGGYDSLSFPAFGGEGVQTGGTTHDPTVRPIERNPDPDVIKQKKKELWEKLVASSRPMADARLGGQPYRGERDSFKSMDTGNEEPRYEDFKAMVNLPDFIRDKMTPQEYAQYHTTMFDNIYNHERGHDPVAKYLVDTAKFLILGELDPNSDPTLLGIGISVLLGFIGADILMDLRDLGGSLKNGDAIGVLVGIVALLPVVGLAAKGKYAKHVLKKIDDLINMFKRSDEAAVLLKNSAGDVPKLIDKTNETLNKLKKEINNIIEGRAGTKGFHMTEKGEVWISHYTTVDNAESIIKNKELLGGQPGSWEGFVYVMLEPSTIKQAHTAGAKDLGAKVMFKIDPGVSGFGIDDVKKAGGIHGQYEPRAWKFETSKLDLSNKDAYMIDLTKNK